MGSKLQSFSSLFQNRMFRIPDYQRGYVWEEELDHFWEDVSNLPQGEYHYMGFLSLKVFDNVENKDLDSDQWVLDEGFKAYNVIDGQQRLTTVLILINEIITFVRDLEENKGKRDENIFLGSRTLKDIVSKYFFKLRKPENQIITYLFGFAIDNPSNEYLRYKIFNEKNSITIKDTPYTQNLNCAKNFFKGEIDDLYYKDGLEGINRLYLKVTLNLMFNVHEFEDECDVFIAFEIMNNQDKQLTNLELLKNSPIYLTNLYSDEKFDELDKTDLGKKINDSWKEVYFQLGGNEDNQFTDDEFLRDYWSIYFGYSRKIGHEYIKFLLNKFSPKNIARYKDEDKIKLVPSEIIAYVNGLKDMAKYWNATFFPRQSENLNNDEILWIERLNRIGIAYFRPMVAVLISRSDISADIRIQALKEIERFIFICFRMGSYNISFNCSEQYRDAHSMFLKELDIENWILSIKKIADDNSKYAVQNFVTDIEFSKGEGFYQWNALKYFMYEYEYSLAKKNNLEKVSWKMFKKKEKDKVSIEHILPKTPTKYYWENQYRQFSKKEIELLTGALGNLLLLSQSVNSSLQNDSFEDKKTSKTFGRRGYQNGSHSEIEVSKEDTWNAINIYERSKKLLEFMEKRWNFIISKEQMDKLVYLNFAVDRRPIGEEFPDGKDETIIGRSELGVLQLEFWNNFREYCKQKGRGSDTALRTLMADNYFSYDISDSGDDFRFLVTVTYGKYVSILIYTRDRNVFSRLEKKKSSIEKLFGDKLDWNASPEMSIGKRIIYKRDADVFNSEKQEEIFEWMIEKGDALKNALLQVWESIE